MRTFIIILIILALLCFFDVISATKVINIVGAILGGAIDLIAGIFKAVVA